MRLVVEQRCQYASILKSLLESANTNLCTAEGEDTPGFELYIIWEGACTKLDKAVGMAMESLMRKPVGHEFDSIELFGYHYLIGIMLHILRDNGFEPRGDFYQSNKSLFRLALHQEDLEIEFLEELEAEAEEEDDEDDAGW